MKMALKFFLPQLFVILLASQSVHAQCNGDPSLCNKRYDEVCYATTHNAFNYQGAFIFPNQSYDIARQMQDGVRGLMLDVYWYNNEPTVYHASNWLGNQPLSALLGDIKTFLDSNGNEIVTIIFECYITAAQMNDVFTQAGLLSYVHTQPVGTPWPTLADMIAANHRLVVFTDATDGAPYPWYHYVWDYGVETHYTAHSRSDFSCNYNRGDSTKSLFILNHFITDASIGTGMIDSAMAVNSNPYLTSRAMACWAATGKIPNFLTVDFYEQGDVMAAKDAINAGFVRADPAQSVKFSVTVAPNPVRQAFTVTASQVGTFTLVESTGRLVMRMPLHSGENHLQMQQDTSAGIYFWQVTSKQGNASGKLLVE